MLSKLIKKQKQKLVVQNPALPAPCMAAALSQPALARQQPRTASTARTMGQAVMSTAQPARPSRLQREPEQPPAPPSTDDDATDTDVDTKEEKQPQRRVMGKPWYGFDFGYDGFDATMQIRRELEEEGRRHYNRNREEERKYPDMEQGASSVGEAPSRKMMYTRPVHMHDKAYCRVTRSYESAAITQTNKIGASIPNQGAWTSLYMGGFNQAISAGDGFFPALATIGISDAVCLSFHFDSSVVTGADATTGPRIVRGGPTAADYVTSPMTNAAGWTDWNNDFYMFSNIFRYSKLEKLEMIVKRGTYTEAGIGVDSNPMQNWSIQNLDRGVLYMAPWSGEPGIVNSYTSGAGAMTTSATNGARNVQFWESLPGVVKFDMNAKMVQDPFEMKSVCIKPCQPQVVEQSNSSGNPVTGADSVVIYSGMPVVDQYGFVAGTQNHNAFGFTLYWYHPDFYGIGVGSGAANTSIPPWIDIKFRATMTYWGLLPPDITAASPSLPLSALCNLPGAEEARQKWYVESQKRSEEQMQELKSSVMQLRDSLGKAKLCEDPPNQQATVQEDYVQVSRVK